MNQEQTTDADKWRIFSKWWKALDDTDYPDQYKLIEDINHIINILNKT